MKKTLCVDMEISYIRQGKSYIATKLTVQAQKLAFGTEGPNILPAIAILNDLRKLYSLLSF